MTQSKRLTNEQVDWLLAQPNYTEAAAQLKISVGRALHIKQARNVAEARLIGHGPEELTTEAPAESPAPEVQPPPPPDAPPPTPAPAPAAPTAPTAPTTPKGVLTPPPPDAPKVVRTASTGPKTPVIAALEAPSPGAVVFKLGSLSIPIDAKDIYECYLLYADIRMRKGITDSFSQVMADSFGFTWRMLVAEPPTMDKVEVIQNGTGNGHVAEQIDREDAVFQGAAA